MRYIYSTIKGVYIHHSLEYPDWAETFFIIDMELHNILESRNWTSLGDVPNWEAIEEYEDR